MCVCVEERADTRLRAHTNISSVADMAAMPLVCVTKLLLRNGFSSCFVFIDFHHAAYCVCTTECSFMVAHIYIFISFQIKLS